MMEGVGAALEVTLLTVGEVEAQAVPLPRAVPVEEGESVLLPVVLREGDPVALEQGDEEGAELAVLPPTPPPPPPSSRGEEEALKEEIREGDCGGEGVRDGVCFVVGVRDWEGEALGEPVGEGERELTPPPRPPLLAVGL